MRFFLVILLVLILSGLTMHQFYVSTTLIRFVPEKSSLQITAQVFADDFEFTLQKLSPGIRLNPDSKVKLADSLTKKYFQRNLVFSSEGRNLPFNYLGKIYRNDLLVAYLEIILDSTVQNFDVKNTLLFDFTDDQKNILHFRNKGKRRSFLSVSSKHTFDIKLNFSE
tara:strand:+ start:842 stop:1342 length:501 start_codon:yes stop_codon:yes gene_type:complete